MTEPESLTETLPLKKAADYLHMHPESVRELAKSGKLKASKPGGHSEHRLWRDVWLH